MELGRFGVWCSLEGGSLAQAVEAAQRIEALGYSALWQPMALRRDVMVTASQQLAATQRLVVATGIATIYERAPLIMAAAQRALGEQSGDRFLLGLGVSHAPFTQPLFGRAYDPPLRAMREYLDGMDAGVALPGAPAGPAQPAGPRVLAALGPKMLALARDRAHGRAPLLHAARAHAARARDPRARSLAVSRGQGRARDRPGAGARARARGRRDEHRAAELSARVARVPRLRATPTSRRAAPTG